MLLFRYGLTALYQGSGLLVLLWSLFTIPAHSVSDSLWLLLAALVLTGANIRLPQGYLMATSTPLIDAALLVLPLQPALLIQAVVAAVTSIRAKRPALRLLFNVANYVVPAGVGAITYQTLLTRLPEGVGYLVAAAATGLLVRYLINMVAIHILYAFEQGRPLMEGMVTTMVAEKWTSGVPKLIALLIMLSYPYAGAWSLLPTVLLLYCLHHLVEFYVQREALVRAAWMDGLTGVANRRAWEQFCAEQKALAAGYLAVVDVDHLKELNDTQGHLVGDQAIVELAARLAVVAGSPQQVYRYGGDEFVVVVQPGDRETAESLRQAVDGFVSTWAARGQSVAASIGIAVAPADGTSISQLFDVADREMYVMKRGTARRDLQIR